MDDDDLLAAVVQLQLDDLADAYHGLALERSLGSSSWLNLCGSRTLWAADRSLWTDYDRALLASAGIKAD